MNSFSSYRKIAAVALVLFVGGCADDPQIDSPESTTVDQPGGSGAVTIDLAELETPLVELDDDIIPYLFVPGGGDVPPCYFGPGEAASNEVTAANIRWPEVTLGTLTDVCIWSSLTDTQAAHWEVVSPDGSVIATDIAYVTQSTALPSIPGGEINSEPTGLFEFRTDPLGEYGDYVVRISVDDRVLELNHTAVRPESPIVRRSLDDPAAVVIGGYPGRDEITVGVYAALGGVQGELDLVAVEIVEVDDEGRAVVNLSEVPECLFAAVVPEPFTSNDHPLVYPSDDGTGFVDVFETGSDMVFC